MHKIERELLKKTKLDECGEDDDRQEYLQRVCEAVNMLEEEDWGSLTTPAKKWANAASNAIKAEADLPEFGEEQAEKAAPKAKGGKPAAKAAKPAAEEEVEEDDQPKAKAKGGNAKPAAAKDGKPRGMSAVTFVRHYVATHPTAAVDEIEDAASKAGYNSLSRSSIGTIRSDFRSIARVLKDCDFLKRGVDLGI